MHIIYRISNNGYKKCKPEYVNNYNCLRNAVSIFKDGEFILIADNINDETVHMIYSVIPDNAIVYKASIGHGAGTFNLALEEALKLPDNEIVYFLEDDYIHKRNSQQIIIEGLELGADYVSLYDHPDKYIDGENPYVSDGGEETKVFKTDTCWFKFTNSNTMSFATYVKTLKRDIHIFREHARTSHPYDFEMWTQLRTVGASLITPIPSYSTHGELKYLSNPSDGNENVLVKWQKILENSLNNITE